MTDEQVADVRDLTRKAGITATITRLRPGHALLAELAPGDRAFVAPGAKPPQSANSSRRNGTKPRPAKVSRGHDRSPKPQSVAAQATTPAKPSSAAAFSAGTRAGRRRNR
jgi:hypothetical protein